MVSLKRKAASDDTVCDCRHDTRVIQSSQSCKIWHITQPLKIHLPLFDFKINLAFGFNIRHRLIHAADGRRIVMCTVMSSADGATISIVEGREAFDINQILV